MVFVINIGNTNTQYATFDEGVISNYSTCPTADLKHDIVPEGVPVAASTVVPEKRDIFPDAFWICHDVVMSINMSLVDQRTVGADRLANAVALADTVELPAICVDCGTAITFDVVDQKRYYYGGAIAPGRKLLRQSLHSYTAQLPEVPIMDDIKQAIGVNTVDAILSGIDIGALHLVKGLIQSIKAELGVDSCQVLITGGDASFFLDHIPGSNDGGIDFTLKGIGLIYQEYTASTG